MTRYGLFLVLFCCAAPLPSTAPEKTPVFLELFTSLGCSSCPPADQLLAEIDRRQPIAGARLIVLSEHVDYWNDAKWSDPFSSGSYSQRQKAYDLRLDADEYTPQLVIDGSTAVVGNSWPRVERAIRSVLHGSRISVRVRGARDNGKANIRIAAGPNTISKKAVVFLALAHNHATLHVGGGENAGRDLKEVPVAYSIKQLGSMDEETSFVKSLSIELPAHSQPGDLRVIVFVRRSDTMQVIGADQLVF
jgi:hypothetical protein